MFIQEDFIKQINKTYAYTLKTLQKDYFKNNRAGLNLFVEYLRYLRDLLIINSKDISSETENNLLMTTIITAIAEYEAYEDYFISGADIQLQNFHWDNFWEIVKLNLREWLSINDSV